MHKNDSGQVILPAHILLFFKVYIIILNAFRLKYIISVMRVGASKIFSLKLLLLSMNLVIQDSRKHLQIKLSNKLITCDLLTKNGESTYINEYLYFSSYLIF